MNFGFQEAKESTGSFGKFGLNQNATFTKVEVTQTKNGLDVLSVNYRLDGADRDGFFTFFEPKENTSFENSKEMLQKQVEVTQMQICELAECFIERETLKEFLKQHINSWKSYITVIANAINKTGKVGNVKVDLFMQYQKKVPQGYKQAFLEVPIFGTAYWGKTFVPHVEGDFKEHFDKEKYLLEYVTEDGKKHPIRRSESNGKYLFNTSVFNQLVLSDYEVEQKDAVPEAIEESTGENLDGDFPF